MGKRHKKTHGLCLRCGKRSFHLKNLVDAEAWLQAIRCIARISQSVVSSALL